MPNFDDIQRRPLHAAPVGPVGHDRKPAGASWPWWRHPTASSFSAIARTRSKTRRPIATGRKSTVNFGNPFAEPDQLTGSDLLRCRWDIVAATDKQQIDRLGKNGLGSWIAPVLWAMNVSLLGYGQAIKALTYNGVPFVYRVKPGAPSVSIDNAREQEGGVGWTATWPYYTWHEFNTLANSRNPYL